MQRYDFLRAIAPDSGSALAVCTGWGAREWWAVRPSEGNLKTRTLGLVSSIAAGLALALPDRKVIAIDGDGAFLMNLCGLPTIALQNPTNLIHLLFDNQCYEASGGTPTASHLADPVALAKAAGYRHAQWANTPESFHECFIEAWTRSELTLIAARIDPGQPADLPQLKLEEIDNKYRFMRYLHQSESSS